MPKTWILSEILKQRLLEEGLSYNELSAATGIGKKSLWRFLNGQGGLNLVAIEALMRRYRLVVTEQPLRKKGR